MIFEIVSGTSLFLFLWVSVSVIYFNSRQTELIKLDNDNKIKLLNMIDEKIFLLDEVANMNEYNELNKLKNKILDIYKH